MPLPHDPAGRHRAIAATFAERTGGTTDWDVPSPVDGWTARDVVRHLTDWFPGFLEDPATQTAMLENPHIGTIPLAGAIDQFYTADVFMHTWDLSRATGQDDRLDAELANQMFSGMQEHDEMLRASGQYGPRVDVAESADITDRLMGFIGRDPSWTPPDRG